MHFPYPEHRWEPRRTASLVLSGGPDRVVRDEPAQASDRLPEPVGFGFVSSAKHRAAVPAVSDPGPHGYRPRHRADGPAR